MTTRTIVFDSPFLLGFDQTRLLIERAAKAATETYPPYNVEQLGEERIRITLAVAGFSPDQLQVTVENRQLTVASPPRFLQVALDCPEFLNLSVDNGQLLIEQIMHMRARLCWRTAQQQQLSNFLK